MVTEADRIRELTVVADMFPIVTDMLESAIVTLGSTEAVRTLAGIVSRRPHLPVDAGSSVLAGTEDGTVVLGLVTVLASPVGRAATRAGNVVGTGSMLTILVGHTLK